MTNHSSIPPQDNNPGTKVVSTIELMSQRDKVLAQTGPCTLALYREIVKDLLRPTPAQIDNFVQFVSEAHSWYKHLPLVPPGVPFRFFIDPFSGFDRVIKPGGHVIHKERTDESQRFHYTWMKTTEYRERFGYLSYSYSGVGTQLFLPSADGVREFNDLPFFSTNDGEFRIPVEVAQEGTVELTGIIHTYAAQEPWWTHHYPYQRKEHSKWPKETGGNATLQRILDVSSGKMPGDLDKLLLPERRRLHQMMTDTIYRMLVLLYDEK